jgi:hypothetical protein
MAKKSLIVKSKRKAKFKVRNILVASVVEDRMPYFANLNYAVSALEN